MNKFLSQIFSFKTKIQSTLLNKYSELENQFIIGLLNSLNKKIRNTIIAEGKNPDYVAPSPQPIIQEIIKPTFNFVGTSAPWVKNPKEHPVLKSRAQGIKKITEPVSTSVKKEMENIFNEMVDDPSYIDDIEVVSGTRPVKIKVTAKKKTIKKSNSPIKKTKTGSFRRVVA